MSEQEKDYEVGYGKPPKTGQFKKGKSGNPRGRPKGARGFKTDLKYEMSQKMTISENGKPMKLSKQQIIIKQLAAKAMKGEIQAINKVSDLAISLLGPDDEVLADASRISPEDDSILQRFVERQIGEQSDD